MSKCHKKFNVGWIDKLAIGLALLCAIHCLILPILLVIVPLIGMTFFVHEDFHLWMLFAVFPTTLLSILIGCKKHKDRLVLIFCLIGLFILLASFLTEKQGLVHCTSCENLDGKIAFSNIAWINTLGGLFLILAHSRNFLLCRKANNK